MAGAIVPGVVIPGGINNGGIITGGGQAVDVVKGGFVFPGLPHQLLDVSNIKIGHRVAAGGRWRFVRKCWHGRRGLAVGTDIARVIVAV